MDIKINVCFQCVNKDRTAEFVFADLDLRSTKNTTLVMHDGLCS